jgi:hypothetical protein
LAALFDQRCKVLVAALLPCGEIGLALLRPRLPAPRCFFCGNPARAFVIALRFKHLTACIEKGGGNAKRDHDQ